MTTKLIKKLSYLKETTDQIRENLSKKGASITPTMTLRQVANEIDNLKTNENNATKHLSCVSNQKEKKAFLVPHFKAGASHLPLLGSFEATISMYGTANVTFCHKDTFAIHQTNNSFMVYQQTDNQTFKPLYTGSTSLVSEGFSNPTDDDCLTTCYYKTTDTFIPTGSLTYPSGGSGSSFYRSYLLWDASGTYLINTQNRTTGIDILKLNKAEDGTYHYTLANTFDTSTLERVGYNFHYAPSALTCPNTFCLSGRYIFQIDPETNALTYQDMQAVSLPVALEDGIIFYGANFFITRDSSSTSATFTFIKATPIDEALAETEAGFWQNPSNYTYEILHQEEGVNLPTTPLHVDKWGYASSNKASKDHYIRPLKHKIEGMADFDYCLCNHAGTPIYGVFFDLDVFISQNMASDDAPILWQKNASTNRFEAEERLCTLKGGHYFSEYGYGVFYNGSSTREYHFENSQLSPTTFSHYQGWTAEFFFKNGSTQATYSSSTLNIKMFKTNGASLSVNPYRDIQINDSLISHLRDNKITRVEDDGSFTTFTAKGVTYGSSHHFVVEIAGQLIAICSTGYPSNDSENGCETYLITLDEATKTFTSTPNGICRLSLSSTYWNFARKIHNTDCYILKNGNILAPYQGSPDGVLHLMECKLPQEVLDKMGNDSTQYVQTFYDGSVALALYSSKKTLLFFPAWDNQTGTLLLKEGTLVQEFDPIDLGEYKGYRLFSPFKRYQFSSYSNFYYIGYTPFDDALDDQTTLTHIESVKTTFPHSATTCTLTGKAETVNGALFCFCDA